MSNDLSKLLADWEFDPDDVTVRMISGDDGRDKVQLRVDLGVLQMEMDGRPDGARPEQCESWLEYYERQQQAYDSEHPDSTPYMLGKEACARLWREGVQYYHRYLTFWHLQLFDLCTRDTQRNLRLFTFVREHVGDDRHKMQFDQWRPYVIMIHTRAVATPLVQNGQLSAALSAIEVGIGQIRDFLDEYKQSHRAEECVELIDLEHWHEEVLALQNEATASKPKSPVDILRKQLDAAINEEKFEEAAKLRDRIRRLISGEQEESD